ncbi:hypothetical protein DL770_000065 [Monosporascus sp. CRB-9-2]|nr:hypothetical protein DL770_000065 [Monosporascus sp. CRB-9-2]
MYTTYEYGAYPSLQYEYEQTFLGTLVWYGLLVALCHLLTSAARNAQKVLVYSGKALGIALLMDLCYWFPVASVVAALVLWLAQAADDGYANGGWGRDERRRTRHRSEEPRQPRRRRCADLGTPDPWDEPPPSYAEGFCALRGETVTLGGSYSSQKPSDAGVLRKLRARRRDRIVRLPFLGIWVSLPADRNCMIDRIHGNAE